MSSRAVQMRDRGLSIVLGSYNRKAFLKLTVDSIRRELDAADFPHETIVVDGGSTDGTIAWLSRQKDIVSIIQHNRGKWRGKPVERRSWGYFMNLGFKSAQGRYICMLSDDCLVVPGALRNGLAYFVRRQSEGVNLGAVPFYFTLNYPATTDYVVMRFGKHIHLNHGIYLNEALRSVGYADEESYSFYSADVDLSFRMISNGYSIEPCPDSKVVHFGHINITARWSNDSMRKDNKSFESIWAAMLPESGSGSTPALLMLPAERFNTSDICRYTIGLRWILLRTTLLARLETSTMVLRIARTLRTRFAKESR
jgi:GT2 family glycosyltransferase